MIHARRDYNRMQDPALADPALLGPGCKPIAEDEPVFLLRAADQLATHNLMDYAQRAEDSGLADVAASVRAHAQRMRDWQSANGCKMPDLPTERRLDARAHAGDGDGAAAEHKSKR